jgi:hypothetical protein
MHYHTNLCTWLRNSLIDLVQEVPADLFWSKNDLGNSPGWALGHLIVENDLMVERFGGNPGTFLRDQRAMFCYGSSGVVESPLDKTLMIDHFLTAHDGLVAFLEQRLGELSATPVHDHPMGSEFKVESDEFLHLAISHPAMHIALLNRWLGPARAS